MPNSVRRVLVALTCATVLSACPSAREGGFGVVRLLLVDAEGNEVAATDGRYDFGFRAVGTTSAQEVLVQNTGDEDLTITGFSKVNAADTATSAGAGVDDATPVFTVTFDAPVPVRSAQTVRLPIGYAPVSAGEHQVVLAMQTTNTNGASARLTLSGHAVLITCDSPELIDFGAVATGSALTRTLELHNERPIEADGLLESPPDAGAFTSAPAGEFLVAPGSSRTATFTFAPTTVGEQRATVRMRWGACPEHPVTLLGNGVSSVVQLTPSELNFGFVTPGVSVTREVVFSNLSFSPVELRALELNDQGSLLPSTLFQLVDTGDGTVGSAITVPPGVRQEDGAIAPGAVTVKFSFTPTEPGGRVATFTATLDGQAPASFSLRGVGGGPDIDVTPAGTLDAGTSAFFPGSTVVTREITVHNVGERPSPPSASANLHLGVGGAAPYWEVVARTNATLDEICVGVFDDTTNACTNTIDFPAEGLVAGDVGLRIPVRIMPAGVGLKEWEVRLFSDDADEPVTTVVIRLNVEQLAACAVTVTPASLDFGVVTTAAPSDLSFSVHNDSATDACLLTELALASEPNGQPVFSLLNGPQPELRLAPNATETVVVRAAPQGPPPPAPVQVNSTVRFTVAHPTTPRREVSLTVTVSSQ